MPTTINYSPSEKRALKLLGTKPKNSIELAKKFYEPEEPPFYGRQIVVGLMSSLIRKTELNNEKFAIKKSERKGPKPISFWKELKNGK